jgi:hypothetical protein
METISLLKKIGIKSGLRVCLLGPTPEAEEAIRGEAPEEVIFLDGLGEGPYDIILFWPQGLAGLVERFTELQKAIRPDGAIWAVMPKKKYAGQRGIDFNWDELQAAALQTDLVDNKTASITEQDYGTRFVIRKARRM